MQTILLRWLVSASSILLVSYIFRPNIAVDNFYTALVLAVMLAIVNTLIRPVLFVLTLPINILTLGLFTLVLNGLLLSFLSSIVKGFTVNGFWFAVLGAFLISFISSLGNRYIVGESNW